jgi:hypothetical protein
VVIVAAIRFDGIEGEAIPEKEKDYNDTEN